MKALLTSILILLALPSISQPRYFIRLNDKDKKPVMSSLTNKLSEAPNDGHEWIELYMSPKHGFIPTSTWLDGSAMDDSKLWAGWYEKTGDIYYRRDWDGGIVQMSEIGFIADGKTDISVLFQKLVDYTPKRMPLNINLAAGEYYSANTLVLKDRNWHFTGYGAAIVFPQGTSGLLYTRSKNEGVDGAYLAGFTLVSQGVVPKYDPAKLPNESTTAYGLQFNGVCRLEDINIGNFLGCGIINWASIDLGLNTSHSIINSARIGSCGLNAIWTVGADANTCSYNDIDIRDCQGWGIKDQSLLGNNYYNVMEHYCALGPFTSIGGGNRSTFISCYSESRPINNTPSVFSDGTTYLGGTHGAGITGGVGIDGGNGLHVNGLGGLQFKDGSINFPAIGGDANRSFKITTSKVEGYYDDRANAFQDALSFHPSLYEVNALNVYSQDSKYNGIRMAVPGAHVNSLMIGNVHLYAQTIDFLLKAGVTFNVGDMIIESTKAGTPAFIQVCTTSGDNPTFQPLLK